MAANLERRGKLSYLPDTLDAVSPEDLASLSISGSTSLSTLELRELEPDHVITDTLTVEVYHGS